jgi:hypothetical protein
MGNRWMRGAEPARQKAAASASHGETEGVRLEDRHRETLLRHEGLAPVRYSQRLETGSGSFAGKFYAGHRIDRPVFFPPLLGPRPRAHDPGTTRGIRGQPGFPFRAIGLAAARSAQAASERLAIETAPALHFKKLEEPKRKQKERENDPKQTSNACAAVAPFEPGSGPKRKNGPGGRRKSLIRLVSAKEIQGFNLDFLPENLDFLPKNLDSLPGNLEILRCAGASA